VYFRDIYGQEAVKRHLLDMVRQNRVSHAQLFLGPSGVGKLPMALAFARYLNCENPTETDSCGKCSSCRKMDIYQHPDVHFVFPAVTVPNAKQKGSVNFLKQWREQLQERPYFDFMEWAVRISPKGNKQLTIYKDDSDAVIQALNFKTHEGRYKIAVVWLPEKMNGVAANKLLKVIEEPYPNTVFLFVSDEPDQLLPTILSRLQRIDFPLLSRGEIEAFIKSKRPELPLPKVQNIARIAKGSLLNVEQIIDEDKSEKQSYLELFTTMMRLCYKRDYLEIIKFSNMLSDNGREDIKNFFLYVLHLLRENFLLNVNLRNLTGFTQEELEFSEKFHVFIHANNVYALYDEINKAYYHIERNGNVKLVLADLMLQIGKWLRKK